MSRRPGARSQQVRFVPAEGASLFALRRPFRAVLSRTGDPHIIRIRLLDEAQDALQSSVQSPGDARSDALAVIDHVTIKLIEAVVLLLDAGDARQRTAAVEVIHHALKQLIRVRRDAAVDPNSARSELVQLLSDLRNLEVIAEDEMQNPSPS
ncbi:MAG: hypothetical protein K1X75_05545 [Leptospirales bacterium]|nr:hypothetical protein [Leptospirales bacterium]